MKHSRLADQVTQAIMDPARLEIKLKKDRVDSAFTPCIQSGGQYDLKLGAAPDERHLQVCMQTSTRPAGVRLACIISRTAAASSSLPLPCAVQLAAWRAAEKGS